MKYLFIVIFSFCVCSGSLFSQEQRQIDSVKNLIPKLTSDTARIRNYLLLGEWIQDIREWPVYNQKGLDLTEKNLGLTSVKAEKEILLMYKAKALNNVGYYLKESNDFKNAILNYEKSKEIFIELNDKSGEATCITNIGAAEVIIGHVADAVIKYERAFNLFKEVGDKSNAAVVLNNIGNIYLNQGNLKLALDHFNEALKMHIATKNVSGEIVVYNNLGSLYFGQNDFETAMDFYMRIYKIYEKQNNKFMMAKSLSDMAVAVKPLDRAKSLHYDSLSLKLYTELDYEEGISKGYNNLGSTFSEMGQIELGLELLTKAYIIREKVNEIEGMCYSSRNIAELYLYMHKFKEALKWAERGYAIAQQLGNIKHIRSTAGTLAKIYAKLKDFEKAYTYHIEFKMFNDSILSSDSKSLAARQLARMEFEKREAELKVEQDKKDLIAEDEKRKQKIITTSVSVVLFLVLVLVLFVFRSLRINQKKNRIITEQKALVENKQKEIIDSIRYAKRIQQSLMPTTKYIAKKLDDLRK
ncbi:MAG: tetratricopeptide repeat protein [Bacteroidia bacterium]|nr:tetratricopeptide repeat protein [Bacteroidia bacterium]